MPAIVTMAKSVSGLGLPMALMLVREQYDVFGPAEHNGTFRGNTHAFVTGRVAIEKFWADGAFREELAVKADVLSAALADAAAMIPGARLKGRGLMQGIDVGSGELAGDICARAYQMGLIIETSGPEDEVVKVLAPITTPEEVFTKGLSILADAVRGAMTATKQAAE